MDYKEILKELNIFTILSEYSPCIVGTYPIGIEVDDSDIDIICQVKHFSGFLNNVTNSFSRMDDFSYEEALVNNVSSLIINFSYKNGRLEIFAQDIPVNLQDGYLHMEIERRLLDIFGKEFKTKIIELKKQGMKTEPAFAFMLNLSGNPYSELLQIRLLSDQEIYKRFHKIVQRNLSKSGI